MHTHSHAGKQTQLCNFIWWLILLQDYFFNSYQMFCQEESSSKQLRLPLLNYWKKPQHEHEMGGK